MSASVYKGTPGSGKSYCAAQQCLEALLDNKYVFTNFQLNTEYFRKHLDKCFDKRDCNNDNRTKHYPNAKQELFNKFIYMNNNIWSDKSAVDILMNFAKLYFEPRKESQGLIVLDEASVLFDKTEFNKDKEFRRKWLLFISQHRKFGFDIIFISQTEKSLNDIMLANIEYLTFHKKANNFGIIGKIISLVRITLFVQIQYWKVGKEVASSRMFRYQNKFNNLYDTFALFD